MTWLDNSHELVFSGAVQCGSGESGEGEKDGEELHFAVPQCRAGIPEAWRRFCVQSRVLMIDGGVDELYGDGESSEARKLLCELQETACRHPRAGRHRHVTLATVTVDGGRHYNQLSQAGVSVNVCLCLFLLCTP